MKIFLINLDKDIERFEFANRQLQSLHLPYERISAVYAKAMSGSEKMSHVSRFRWWCATGRPPRDGEIGCALSHYSIYRRMIESKLPCACILEDDVCIDARISYVLSQIANQIDATRPHVILLSNHSDPYEQGPEDGNNGFHSLPDDNRFRIRRTEWDMFTEGYVITLAAAKALLKANYPLRTPCDAWPRWVRNGDIELYHAFPTVCSQNKNDFASTTVGGGVWVSEMKPFRRFVYKVGRWVGKNIDRIIT